MDERSGDLNSPEYWNKRFVVDWAAEGGPLQTVFFAELCVRELPQWLVDEVRDERLSIFDYGCALGDALPVWRRLFPQSQIGGGDVAQAALGTARRLYPDFAFTDLNGTDLNGGDESGPLADLVYCSNTLEHFADWRAVLERLAHRARRFVVVMVPFEEDAPIEEHAATFEYDTLPPGLTSGHRLLHLSVVDAAAEPDSQWKGLQLVAVYGAERPVGQRGAVPAGSAAATGTASPGTMVFDLRDSGAAMLAPLLANLAAMSRERRRMAAAAAAAETEAFHLKNSEAEAVDRAVILQLTLTGVLREWADLVRGLEKAQQWVIGRLAEFDPQLAGDHDLSPIGAEWPAAAEDDLDAAHRTALGRMIEAAHRGNRLALGFLDRSSRWQGERAELTRRLRQARSQLEATVAERDHMRAPSPRPPPPARIAAAGPLVSIVLPVFNQAYLVDAAIAGVLSQTYANWELIVVDDGSTDDLAERVRRHLGDRRVLLLRQPNQRLPAALNAGFARASGELLIWTSADNIMLPRQLERLVAALAAHPEAGLAYSDYWAIDDRGEPLADPDWRHHNRDGEIADLIRLPDTVTIENFHRSGDNFIGASFLYRRAVADLVGPYADDTFGGEDYDFWLRLHLVTEFRHVAEPLYKYRVHADTLTARAADLGLYDNIRELLAADRWRLETLLDERGLGQGKGLLRPSAQFHTALLRRCRPVRYGELAAAASDGGPEPPLVVDIDVPLRMIDADALQEADILLCRSALTAAWLRRHAWPAGARPKRILLWQGEATPAVHHAYIQAFADQVTAPLAMLSTRQSAWAPARLDEAFPPSRILILVERWSAGGMESVVADLACSLAAAGGNVTVASAQGVAPPSSAFGAGSIRTAALRGDVAALEALLRQERIEVVNYHHSRFGLGIARDFGAAAVYTQHNCYLWMDDQARAAVGADLSAMDAVIAVSRQAAQFADRQFAVAPERLFVVGNGLREDFVTPATRPASEAGAAFVVAMVASLTRPKLQHVALAAFAEAAAEIPALRLRLIGAPLDPQYQAELEAQIAALPCRDRIELCGGISRRETATALAAAHVFLLPSLVEGCSMALLEAAASGCVCIASDVGAARDLLLPDGSVILLPSPLGELDAVTQQQFLAAAYAALPQHRAGIAAALRTAWQDYGILAAATEDTRRLVRRLADMRQMTEAYLDIYTLARRGGNAGRPHTTQAAALRTATTVT